MCGKDKSAPAPAARAQGKPDPQSQWAFGVIERLATKVNPEIQIKKNGNKLKLGNISDQDLQKLKFLTPTDQSNRIVSLANIGVSIKDSTGKQLPLQLPGLKGIASQIYNTAAADAFMSGNDKTFKPFKQAAGTQSNVGNVVDMLTAMMPSIPDSAGKDKTYNLILHTSNNYHRMRGHHGAAPYGGLNDCPAANCFSTPSGCSCGDY